MCVTVNIEDPNLPNVHNLLGAGIDHMQSLYLEKRKDGLSAAPSDVSDSRALGCCALLLHRGFTEIKRMYVVPSAWGHDVASHLLEALESVAKRRRLLAVKAGDWHPTD